MDVVLKDIEDNKAELAIVKEELKNATDPVEKSGLKKRRDRLEDMILTLEKRALALTLAQRDQRNTILSESVNITAFRDAILKCGKDIKVVEGGETVQFPSGIHFPVAQALEEKVQNSLFIRSFNALFYDYFSDNVMKKGSREIGLIMIGPPGVGKTFLGLDFVRRLILEGKTVVFEHVLSNMFYVIPPTGECRAYSGAANPLDAPELCDPDTVHGFDASAGGRQVAKYRAKLFVVSSPNGDSFKQVAREGCVTLVVPSYTAAELQTRRKYFPSQSDAEFADRLSRFGDGSIRLVLQKSKISADQMIEKALDKCSGDTLLELLRNPLSGKGGKLQDGNEGPSSLFKTNLRDGADPTAITSYLLYGKIEWNIASQWVAFQVISRHCDDVERFAARAATVFRGVRELAVSAGYMHEAISLISLAKGGRFEVTAMADKEDDRVTTFLELPARSLLTVSGLRTMSDALKACTDKHSFFNLGEGMVVFDGFSPSAKSGLFQCTQSKAHTVNVSHAAAVCNSMPGEKEISLYFVVPPSADAAEWLKPRPWYFGDEKMQRAPSKLLSDGNGTKKKKTDEELVLLAKYDRELSSLKTLKQYALKLPFYNTKRSYSTLSGPQGVGGYSVLGLLHRSNNSVVTARVLWVVHHLLK